MGSLQEGGLGSDPSAPGSQNPEIASKPAEGRERGSHIIPDGTHRASTLPTHNGSTGIQLPKVRVRVGQ